MNLLNIVNEGAYIMILCIYLFIHLFNSSVTERVKYQYFGFSLIGLTSIVIIINFGVCFYESYKMIKQLCNNCGKRKGNLASDEAQRINNLSPAPLNSDKTQDLSESIQDLNLSSRRDPKRGEIVDNPISSNGPNSDKISSVETNLAKVRLSQIISLSNKLF